MIVEMQYLPKIPQLLKFVIQIPLNSPHMFAGENIYDASETTISMYFVLMFFHRRKS